MAAGRAYRTRAGRAASASRYRTGPAGRSRGTEGASHTGGDHMKRQDIPVRLRVARGADIDRMPLAKMASPAEVTGRLLAHDEFQRRARVPHLDADLYRHRIRQATQVLTTSDPAEAAALIKAAGVTPRAHRPAHAAAKSAASTRPPETVAYPAIDTLVAKAAAAQSVATALLAMASDGQLPQLERDIGRMRRHAEAGRPFMRRGQVAAQAGVGTIAKAVGESGAIAKALEYREKAFAVSDPGLRQGYLELAKQAERAGVA